MYGTLLLLLLTLPLLFQTVFGRKAIYSDLKLNLSNVCLISFCSQILFYYFAFQLLDYKLRIESNGQLRCGMPFLGLIMVEFFFMIVLIIVMAIQFFIKRAFLRNAKKH